MAGTGHLDLDGWVPFYYGFVNLSNRVVGNGLLDDFDNRSGGIVDADGTGIILRGGTRNSGLLRARNNGILSLSALNNTGGRVEALAGGLVGLSGSIQGGTLTAHAGGIFTGGSILGAGVTLMGPGTFGTGTFTGSQPVTYRLNDGQTMTIGENPVLESGTFTLTGATTINLIGSTRAVTFNNLAVNFGAATLDITDGTLNLQGTVINRANIHLRGVSGSTRMQPVGVATLSGGGSIFGAESAGSGGRLVNIDNTIHIGAGSLGGWTGGWENYGTITSSGSSSLLVPTGSVVINRGVINGGISSGLDIVGVGASLASNVVDNRGGEIGGTNSTVTLRNAIIHGGIIDGRIGKVVGSGTAASAGESNA